ncbi:hypothetical protein F5884DRAFT_796984 [Xylogone sp. PMI_703]|nr:hypothetical protein F5884DRAFT_796984 [Xylogone sp. PMI_703]
MSKRQFKSQASSSRATTGTGFGGFGFASAASSLSYLTAPPDLSTISDANVVVSFKNLLKKDSTTKAKALEDLKAYVQQHPYEKDGGVEEPILDAWVQLYSRTSIDNSRRVRELSHDVQYELLKSARKRMEKHIPKIVGSWLAGTYDRDRGVARAARDGVSSFLDTIEKQALFWKRCQAQILQYAQEAINETPETLSDERSVSPDDAQSKYYRVLGASLSLVLNLLLKLEHSVIAKYQDKYEGFLLNNKKLWALTSAEDAFVRRTVDQLLIACLDKQPGIVEQDLEIISHAFIAEGLRASQTTSAFQLIQALEKLTVHFSYAWTSAYKSKRPPLSRLRHFVEKGSQGGPAEYWNSLQSLVVSLPQEVLPVALEESIEFLTSLRGGVTNREEVRTNSTASWTCYFETIKLLLSNLSNPLDQGKLCQESVYPIFEQYLRPSLENNKWASANSISVVATAYILCTSIKEDSSQKSFNDEWQRLAETLITSIKTSLPEQSKDFHKSQTSVVAESRRWFGLISEILKTVEPQVPKLDLYSPIGVLVQPSSAIINSALEVLVSRNGKPYSAAATIDAAIQQVPTLLEILPDTQEAIEAFLSTYLSKLIISPSAEYLISSLNSLRASPRPGTFFKDVWLSAVHELLLYENDDNKFKSATALISNDAVADLAQQNSELQAFLYEAAVKSLQEGSNLALLESALSFNSFNESTLKQLLNLLIEYLESTRRDYVNNSLKALEIMSTTKPALLQQPGNTHIALLSTLLALTELSDQNITPRINNLRAVVENVSKADNDQDAAESPILHVIRQNLEIAGPQSLAIETLLQQAKTIIQTQGPPIDIGSLFPNSKRWLELLSPLLSRPLNPALSITNPLHGSLSLIEVSSPQRVTLPRDLKGYSAAFRMALYSSQLALEEKFLDLDIEIQVDILYLLMVVAEIATDQVGLSEENMLWSSLLDPDVAGEVQEFTSTVRSCIASTVHGAKLWRDDNKDGSLSVIGVLISKLLKTSNSNTPTGFYAARALSSLLSELVERHGWQQNGSEDWLGRIDVLKSSTSNVFGAIAILTGLREALGSSKIANNLCNRLISDIAGVKIDDNERTLRLLVLANAALSIYNGEEVPVAKNRLIFAVQQILSRRELSPVAEKSLKEDGVLAEICRTLQKLLPTIKDMYGPHWVRTLNLCQNIWSTTKDGFVDDKLASVEASLRLVTVLRQLAANTDDEGEDAEDDTDDDSLKGAFSSHSEEIHHGIQDLLKLNRQRDTQPQRIVDEMIYRDVLKIPLYHIKKVDDDLSWLYPLLASDFRFVQSGAYHLLRLALQEAQEQLSINVILEKRDAQLPEELMSLLLESPSIDEFPDEILATFPTAIRSYLLSWHLVFDSYIGASFKVRNDYTDNLKAGNYLPGLLGFLSDVLGHSSGHPLNLDRAGFDAQSICFYDMKLAETETDERNMQWLLINLYYLCLKYTPNLVKNWWIDCKQKQTRIAVEGWTGKFFSPLVIADALDEVTKWAAEQETPSEDDKELQVKVSKKSREIYAGYEVDDTEMKIVIRLPEIYPLEGVKVDGVNRVAVSEKKWTSWLMITQGVVTFSNGSITDGLSIFRKNVTGALKGQTECAICYSIISSDKKIPDKRCQTCKNMFHSSCLFKWFATSNQSTCPLCRNTFNYGVDASRARRVAGPA